MGGELPAAQVQVPPNCDLTLGLSCIDKSRPGATVWTMPADERFSNPVGVLQGGFLSALCDSAMGASAITWARAQEPGTRVTAANAEIKVSFVKAVRPGGLLTCTAAVIGGGRRACFVEAEVHAAAGALVAKASSTYLLKPY